MGVHHMFGVLLASNKVEGQATTITFLDILLDILCLKICLSQEKPLSPQAIHWREKHITHKMYKASIKKSDEFCKKYADSFHADITTLPMTFQSQPHQVPKLKLVNSAIKKRRARNPKLICLPILRQGLQTLVLIMARLQSHRVSKLVLLRFFQACWTPQSYKHSMMLLPTCHLRMWQWITTWAYHSRTSKTKWVKRTRFICGRHHGSLASLSGCQRCLIWPLLPVTRWNTSYLLHTEFQISLDWYWITICKTQL